MTEADPNDVPSDSAMQTSRALARWAIGKAIGRSLQLDPEECPGAPSVNNSLASTTMETAEVGTSGTLTSLSTPQDGPSNPDESHPETQVKGPQDHHDRRPSRVFEPVLRPRQSVQEAVAMRAPPRRSSRLPNFPRGSTEASVLLALQTLDAKYREPLLSELVSMSQELRAAKDRALTQSRQNSQLQKEVEDQAKLFRTLVDLQQQNKWFEERREKVDGMHKMLLDNEQIQIERLRMAAEDVAAARHRLEEPNEIKKALVAKRQQMTDRIQALEEELKQLDVLAKEADIIARNTRIDK